MPINTYGLRNQDLHCKKKSISNRLQTKKPINNFHEWINSSLTTQSTQFSLQKNIVSANWENKKKNNVQNEKSQLINQKKSKNDWSMRYIFISWSTFVFYYRHHYQHHWWCCYCLLKVKSCFYTNHFAVS